ncbi:MAG TPA: hypothetical protein VKS21_04455, partial [Spirochaetota bacterium]|nr:hypothetical protein [Spirochaetota bacterium]
MMKKITLVVTLISGQLAFSSRTVRLAESFDLSPWNVRIDRYADTVTFLDARNQADLRKRFLRLEVLFSSNNHTYHCQAVPAYPLIIPGTLKKITFDYQNLSSNSSMTFIFAGPDRKNYTRLFSSNFTYQWQSATIMIPEAWPRPLTLKGLKIEKIKTRSVTSRETFKIDNIHVQTDPQPENSSSDPGEKTVKLLHVREHRHALCNVFSGTTPVISLELINWKNTPVKTKLIIEAREKTGMEQTTVKIKKIVDQRLVLSVSPKLPVYGSYNLKITAETENDQTVLKSGLAWLPPQPKLTETEKSNSPYGLNVHGGRRVFITPF